MLFVYNCWVLVIIYKFCGFINQENLRITIFYSQSVKLSGKIEKDYNFVTDTPKLINTIQVIKRKQEVQLQWNPGI